MGMCSGVEVGVVQGGATRMLLEVLLLCIASTTKSFLFENVGNELRIDDNNNDFHIRLRLFLRDFIPVATNSHLER